ncbi:uncharacterized protein C24H6.02c [Henckelia pumila]|uniref:uncharacterized protein C24H6.02c n=1 Tax=Henckelia pumila TaxID=405737 RepID=UPI003C6E54D1
MNSCHIPALPSPLDLSFTLSSRFCRPNFYPNSRHLKPSSLRISHFEKKTFKQWHREPIISCSIEDCSEAYPEPTQSSVSKNAQEEASINLNLPRRSLSVTFTCNACGSRSQRLINRLAYERGLVYVQCSGCSQYHKLVDNLGLVVEYNLQEVVDSDTSTGQI